MAETGPCNFCGAYRSARGTMISCATAAICDICVDSAVKIVAARRALKSVPVASNDSAPATLDGAVTEIVGQGGRDHGE